MTEAEALWYIGALFGSYLVGWGCGFIIYSFKFFLEKI